MTRRLLFAFALLAVLLIGCVTIDTGGSYDGITLEEHDELYDITMGEGAHSGE